MGRPWGHPGLEKEVEKMKPMKKLMAILLCSTISSSAGAVYFEPETSGSLTLAARFPVFCRKSACFSGEGQHEGKSASALGFALANKET